MTDTSASSFSLAFKQGYVFLSNSSCHKVFEEKIFNFFEIFSFFCVTMKFVRNLLTSTGKWGDGEGDVTLKAQMAYFFKICETFLSKKRHTEAPSWKNRHRGKKFRRLCQIQSHFWLYVTMEIWLQRFHFASKHFWLANAENIVNSIAIGKKTNWKNSKIIFRHSET